MSGAINLETAIAKGLHSAIPAAGHAGRLYYETDTGTLFRDNGSSWDAIAGTAGLVDDTAYDATSWNGDTTHAPSKNAVRDKIETLTGATVTYVSDTFNRADAGTVGAPDTAGDNPIYYKDGGAGDWGIASNTLAPKSSQTENAVLWDVGCTRYKITATMSTKGTDCGIVFRAFSDTSWLLVHANTGTKYTLHKRIGGSYTQLATGSTQTPSNGDVIVIYVSAAHIKVVVNGTTEIDYADTALLLPNRTLVGFRAAAETTVRFDNFKVEQF